MLWNHHATRIAQYVTVSVLTDAVTAVMTKETAKLNMNMKSKKKNARRTNGTQRIAETSVGRMASSIEARPQGIRHM